jgi:hypothetical protein
MWRMRTWPDTTAQKLEGGGGYADVVVGSLDQIHEPSWGRPESASPAFMIRSGRQGRLSLRYYNRH